MTPPLLLATLGFMDASWVGVIGVGIGAALAGLVSVVQTYLQSRAQARALDHQASMQERAEQRRFSLERWQWHADLRRRSYIDCLVSVEKCSDFIEFFEAVSESLIASGEPPAVSAWNNDETPEAMIKKFDQRMVDETFDRIQIVRLDGPSEVTECASQLLNALLAYWESAKGIGERRSRSEPHSSADHEAFIMLFRELRAQINRFITIGSDSLTAEP